MSVSLISRDERDFSVFRQKGGKDLLFCRGMHWEAKNLLKRFAFSEKFEIILSLTNKGYHRCLFAVCETINYLPRRHGFCWRVPQFLIQLSNVLLLCF